MGCFVAPFLALYLIRERGFSVIDAGKVVALYGAGATVGSIVGGVLADRIGRRATMLGSLFCGSLSVAAMAGARAPGVLAVIAFIAAFIGECYRPAMAAAVTDLVPPSDRARAFGLFYWVLNLGSGLGLIIAGLLTSRGLFVLLLADSATTFLFGVLVALRVPETRPTQCVRKATQSGALRVFADWPYAVFLLLNFTFMAMLAQSQLAMPVDLVDRGMGADGYSYLMALNCIAIVLLQPVLANGLKGVGSARLLAGAALFLGVGFGVNAFAHGLPMYAAGVTLWTVGEMVGFPTASALVGDFAPPALRGRYQGAFAMTLSMASMLAPLIGSQVMARAGARMLWMLCIAIGVLMAVGHLTAGSLWRARRVGTAGPETS